ncbi:MAG: hypothetical protein WC865_09100 [Bacteroidales bacterium]
MKILIQGLSRTTKIHAKEETTEIYLKAFENKTLDDASELLNLK